MQRGFKDVGYLFAPCVLSFRPLKASTEWWRKQVHVLATEIQAGSQSGVRRWFRVHYPPLMELIPSAQEREFAKGIIEQPLESAADCWDFTMGCSAREYRARMKVSANRTHVPHEIS